MQAIKPNQPQKPDTIKTPVLEPISERLLLQSKKDLEEFAMVATPTPTPMAKEKNVVIDKNDEPSDILTIKPMGPRDISIIAEKKEEGRIFVTIQENTCSHCGAVFMNYSEPIIVIPGCGHAFHLQCIPNPKKCTACNPRSFKFKGRRFPLDHGDDPMLTKQIEQACGRQGSVVSRRNTEENVPDLTLHQKNALTKGVINPLEIYNARFDKTHFKNNQIAFEKICSLGITLYQLYYKCDDIKMLSDLVDIGLKKGAFSDPQNLQIEALARCYRVDKDTLEDTFDIRLDDLVNWGYHPRDFRELGWDMQTMINSGMGLTMFSKIAKTQRSPKAFLAYLKLDKTHFQKLKIKDKHIQKWKWNIENTKKIFKITPQDSVLWNMADQNTKKPAQKKPLINFVSGKDRK